MRLSEGPETFQSESEPARTEGAFLPEIESYPDIMLNEREDRIPLRMTEGGGLK